MSDLEEKVQPKYIRDPKYIYWGRRPSPNTQGPFFELEMANLLSQKPEFQHQQGAHKGKTDCRKVAEALNNLYHQGQPIRSGGNTGIRLKKYSKELREGLHN